MVKFNVGDKVKVLDPSNSHLAMGDVGVITEIFEGIARVAVVGKKNAVNWINMMDGLKLIEPKSNSEKTQIQALEERVATLEKLVEDYFKLPVEPSTDVIEDKPTKSPNQLRAEIIEKAKGFIEIEQYRRKRDGKFVIKSTTDPFDWSVRKIQFVVNDKKRTVALLVFGESGKVIDRHTAKCNPSDVFNEHIGKAIALGRALGLDVSEFEGAVQPTEIVKGMRCKHYIPGYEGTVNYFDGKYWRSDENIDGSHSVNLTIINDTEAIYEEVE